MLLRVPNIRFAGAILFATLAATTVARADELDARLQALATAVPGEPRLAAARAVIDGKHPVAALIARLRAPRTATEEEKRAVLLSFHAEVPNEKGSFTYPGRPKKKAPEDPDWLAELARIPAGTPALGEGLEVVTLLRALAASQTETAADAILDFGFTPAGLVYRDETGRQIRAMAPHSLPTLLRASQDRKRDGGSFARYANYQLDRLSMNRPSYALAAAPDDAVEVAMLRAIRDVRHPDAVTAVLDRVDDPSNAVRKAAREAWLAYVTGPPPPPAPKAYRKLPGGKKSDEPLPLYLTYRELADQELRRVLHSQLGSPPSAKLDPAAMTRMLFDLYDRRRAEESDAQVAAVQPLADAGQWEQVAARYDAILRHDPFYVRRAAMAPAYLELGKLHASRKEWEPAITALHKALALDPEGATASEAQAQLAAARAGREEAAGRSSREERAEAAALDPGAAGAEEHPTWLVYAGLGAAALGLVLVGVALLVRRRGAARAVGVAEPRRS
jgi:tetratricopeptide (TPR) repeat protein